MCLFLISGSMRLYSGSELRKDILLTNRVFSHTIYAIVKKTENGKSNWNRNRREELSSAESSSGKGFSEVHPGVDLLKDKDPVDRYAEAGVICLK